MARVGTKRQVITPFAGRYRIDELLMRREWRLIDLVRATGLRFATISDIARGARLGSPKTLERIAQALDVTVPELYSEYEYKDGGGGNTKVSNTRIAA